MSTGEMLEEEVTLFSFTVVKPEVRKSNKAIANECSSHCLKHKTLHNTLTYNTEIRYFNLQRSEQIRKMLPSRGFVLLAHAIQ